MTAIPLSQGKFAHVDAGVDLSILRRVWHYTAKGYAATNEPKAEGGQRTVLLHRLIMNAPDDCEVDHIDGDPLNNRTSNLRLVSRQQNMFNQRKRKGTVSRFKGVSWCKRSERWLAQIMVNKRNKFLGYFSVEEEAAAAYDSAAREFFGEFARPNFGS